MTNNELKRATVYSNKASSLVSSNPQGTEGPIPVFFEKQSIPGYTVFRISDAQAPSTHTIKFM